MAETSTEFGPRRTVLILAIVAGCFAMLWPKIVYPMMMATVTPLHSTDRSGKCACPCDSDHQTRPRGLYPPPLSRRDGTLNFCHSLGCCDMIFENDVTAVDIMQELCHNIIRHHHVDPRVRDALDVDKFKRLSPSNTRLCKEEVLARCGIDLSSFLAEKEQLKKSYKQVLKEIRGSNSSLCFKTQFGVPLSRLGTSHLNRYHILMPHSKIFSQTCLVLHLLTSIGLI
jgi:hypothetical protein